MVECVSLKDALHVIRFDLAAQEFARALEALLREQYARNPVYRRYAGALGFRPLPESCWQDFPPLPVEAFKQAEPVASFDPSRSCAVFETSGTTGAGSGLHYFEDLSWYERSLEASFLHFMPDVSRHLWISLVPPSSALPRSSLSHMLTHLARRLPAQPVRWVTDGAFRRDTAAWKNALEQAQQTPAALFATVFALVQALDEAAGRGECWKLAPGTLLFLTGGSKGRVREVAADTLETMIRERLGVASDRVFFEYGMTELSSQGYSRGFDGVYTFPPWMRVLARDPVGGGLCPPGVTGVLELYDLANVGSIAALRTRDAGQVLTSPDEPCSRVLLQGRVAAAAPRGCSLPYET